MLSNFSQYTDRVYNKLMNVRYGIGNHREEEYDADLEELKLKLLLDKYDFTCGRVAELAIELLPEHGKKKISQIVCNTFVTNNFLSGETEGSYVHTQATVSNVWTIPHFLGYTPNVFVQDENGEDMEGDVSSIDENTLSITFNQQVAGKAYLS